jgi:hypothetical protein
MLSLHIHKGRIFSVESLPVLQPAGVDFNQDEGFLAVTVDMDAYGYEPRAVVYKSRRFEPKDELHITILSQQAAEQVNAHFKKNRRDGQAVEELIQKTDWSFKKQERLYHIREDDETETIVQMVEVVGLEDFLTSLGNILEAQLDPPPTHLTLYMRGTDIGIGLPTNKSLTDKLQTEVKPEELEFQDEIL